LLLHIFMDVSITCGSQTSSALLKEINVIKARDFAHSTAKTETSQSPFSLMC
jgi:hypothetical protein